MNECERPESNAALFKRLKEGLSKKSTSPLYIQLDQTLRHVIEHKMLAHGKSLPSERTIAEALGISRVTVRKTIERLEQFGYCEKRRGAGTFVLGQKSFEHSHKTPLSICSLYGFSEDMQRRGFKPKSIFIDKKTSMPNAEEVFALHLTNESVVRLTRVRLADNAPIAIEVCCIPCSIISNETLIEDSVYQAMQQAGHKPYRATQRISACSLNNEQANLLEVEPNAPALFIRRVAYDTDNNPLEYTKTYYRADRFDFVAEVISE